jgi:predicted transglutaminase-like protease
MLKRIRYGIQEKSSVPTKEEIDNEEVKILSNRLRANTPKETLTNILEWQDRNLKFWEERWFTSNSLRLISRLLFMCIILAFVTEVLSLTSITLIFVITIFLLLGASIPLIVNLVKKYKNVKRIIPEFRIGDTFKISLPVEKILKYRLSVCRDYAKLTSALLLNIYPNSELYSVSIPNIHVATAIKINNKMYMLDQKLPVLTLEKWVQIWKERLKKKKLKLDLIRIIKDMEGIKTKRAKYTESIGQINKIDTTKIVDELKRKLEIKEIDKGPNFKDYLEITIPLYAYLYEEDDITEFSIIESIKNRIEDELTGKIKEIYNLTINQKDKDLVLKIQLTGERNEA